ncbi:MAG: UDP-glucose 6-dehydrogenase, partial [Verrucomicrobiaceae bacterium]|nr:UDP-glucose 6-dehydrogenase [Verrucomicrobiaceae bacterium]
EPLEGADALAIVTDWNQFRNPDFGRIRKLLKIPAIFDGRNLYDAELAAGMGFDYVSIGRAAAAPSRGKST